MSDAFGNCEAEISNKQFAVAGISFEWLLRKTRISNSSPFDMIYTHKLKYCQPHTRKSKSSNLPSLHCQSHPPYTSPPSSPLTSLAGALASFLHSRHSDSSMTRY